MRLRGVTGRKVFPDDTIRLHFRGVLLDKLRCHSRRLNDAAYRSRATDDVGKGLSGGRNIVQPSEQANIVAEENIIIGNVAFYGGNWRRSLHLRDCWRRPLRSAMGVRNAVVEGVGDHGCEYMTGGRVIVLGQIGRNFAAWMSRKASPIYMMSMARDTPYQSRNGAARTVARSSRER